MSPDDTRKEADMKVNKNGRRIPADPQGSIRERMAAAVILDPVTGCLVWQRALQKRGYGVIYFEGKLRLAHRMAFYLAHGRWPAEGLVTDHVCENKACVNPEHLRELTNSQNLLRAHRHLDPAREPLRIRQRIANAKYRRKQRGGDQIALV